MALTLLDLPAELLLYIHTESLSPALPHVSRHLRNLFSNTSSVYRADYLLRRHPHKTLSRAIKYPICTLEVVHALERLAGKPLRCPELPRRLAKGDHFDFELIRYLLTTYKASANSKSGYFLARAVLHNNLPLINLLLEHGADPGLKEGWAVVQAISTGDLGLVKLLLERPVSRPEGREAIQDESELSSKKRRRSGGVGELAPPQTKKRKMEIRCAPTSEMLEVAVRKQYWPLVDYLSAQGAVPNLDVLQLLT